MIDSINCRIGRGFSWNNFGYNFKLLILNFLYNFSWNKFGYNLLLYDKQIFFFFFKSKWQQFWLSLFFHQRLLKLLFSMASCSFEKVINKMSIVIFVFTFSDYASFKNIYCKHIAIKYWTFKNIYSICKWLTVIFILHRHLSFCWKSWLNKSIKYAINLFLWNFRTGARERKYEEICYELATSYIRIKTIWDSIRLIKETKPYLVSFYFI